MKKTILLTIMLGIFLITLVSADLGTFEQTECVDLKGNLDAVNVSISVYFPNSTVAFENVQMVNVRGDIWEYNFCNTLVIGEYIYDYCDHGGNNCKENTFLITPSGQSDNLGLYIILILIVYLIGFIGFFGKSRWVSALGGLGMLALGVYFIGEGIVIYRDWFTNLISYLTIGLGGIFSLVPLIEFIQETM